MDRQPALTVRVATLSALGGLYVAQGLPYGFFTQTLPVVLKQHEVGLEAIGLSSLLALPWALKALWAPLVDRLPRRATLLALQLASVALLIGLSLLDPGHLGALAAVILTINLLAATQDIATDGLAVRTLTDDDRGLGNALQVAGYRAGMIVGGGALLSASGWLGWSWTVLTLAGLTALATLPALAVPDAPPPERPPAGNPWGWLALPGALPWCLVLATFKLGDYLGQGMLRPWLVDEGLSVELLGLLLGLGGFGAGLVGALIGGWSVPRLGLRPALIGAGALQVTGVGGYAAASLGWVPAWPAVLWEHAVGGVATTALFTAMMTTCRPERAGTDYTLQASVVVFASGLGAACSGFLAARWGYPATFATGALLAAAAPLLAASPAARMLPR